MQWSTLSVSTFINIVYNKRWLPLKSDIQASMSKHRMWSEVSFVLVKFLARIPQNYKILNRFIAYQFYTRGRISASRSEEMHYKKSNCGTKKSSLNQAKINDKYSLCGWFLFGCTWLQMFSQEENTDFNRRVTLNVS